jgi:hypothetical protein
MHSEKIVKLGALILEVLLLLFSIIELSSEIFSRDSLFVVDAFNNELMQTGHVSLKAIGRVDGKLMMLDREAWRSRIKMIAASSQEVDSSKREEDIKIRRV